MTIPLIIAVSVAGVFALDYAWSRHQKRRLHARGDVPAQPNAMDNGQVLRDSYHLAKVDLNALKGMRRRHR